MKYIFFLVLAFIVCRTTAQSSNGQWSICVTQSQSIRSTDSLVLKSTMFASDGFLSVAWTVSAVAPAVAPALPIPIITTNGTQTGLSTITLNNLPVGVYTFTANGKSTTGVPINASTTITVVPPPPGRTVTGWTGSFLNGVYKFTYTYSDGQP